MRPLHHIRREVDFTFLSGAAGGDLIQTSYLPLEGELLNIHQINGTNTNARTAKLEILDEDSIVIFDGTAKAHAASYEHEFGVTIRRILSGGNTLRCTISGDPGVSNYLVTAVITLYGRDG